MAAIHKLTAKFVTTVAAPGVYGDGGNLWLQVREYPSKTGLRLSKSWLVRFTINGKQREMGLGPIQTFNLKQARDLAQEARQLLKSGVDPLEARRAERDARRTEQDNRIDFQTAAEKFLAAHEPLWTSPVHRRQWRNQMRDYVMRPLGNRPVAAITEAVLNDALAPYWVDRAETAERVRQRVRRVIKWVEGGMRLPTTGKAKRVRHFEALPWRDVPAFMASLRQVETTSALALRFLILTASRSDAVRGATWDEIDTKARVWMVPASRPGTKLDKDHPVPLSDEALTVLQTMRDQGIDSPYIFPGRNPSLTLSGRTLLNTIRAAAGDGSMITAHGFRSTFRNWAAETDACENIVAEAALAHTVPDAVEKAYRRGNLFKRRTQLMQQWADFCTGIPASGNVVPLKGRVD